MNKSAIIGIVAVLLIIGGVLLYMNSDTYKTNSVDSFAECMEAGFPVMESSPRQCRAGDKLFIEDVNDTTGGTVEGGENDDNTVNTPSAPVVTSMLKVNAPLPGATVSSPLVVSGEARGNWYFEASFPVRVLDANGRQLAVEPAQAQGEWMTTEFVPFSVTLTFATPSTSTGTLVLERDNPSGLPEHAAEVRIPIRFGATSAAERQVVVYHYNESRDKDASGNIMCSQAGLQGVTRSIPSTMTPIQDAIKLLLRGEITAAERTSGMSTEFPLQGVTLEAASLSSGVLTLTFSDPENRTTGGSCRAAILAAQITATAKQFPGVNSVLLRPADLFQP